MLCQACSSEASEIHFPKKACPANFEYVPKDEIGNLTGESRNGNLYACYPNAVNQYTSRTFPWASLRSKKPPRLNDWTAINISRRQDMFLIGER